MKLDPRIFMVADMLVVLTLYALHPYLGLLFSGVAAVKWDKMLP